MVTCDCETGFTVDPSDSTACIGTYDMLNYIHIIHKYRN